jgi:GT2 family glycosyltransferase
MQLSDIDDWEIVIVDQSDDDSTGRAVGEIRDDRVTYVHSDVVGVSQARNLAVTLTTAPVVAITDDDCIVPPNWLRGIARPFAQDENLGVVFCDVIPAPFAGVGYTPAVRFDRAETISNVGQAWRAAKSGLCLGAGMAVRRSAFEQVRGFDQMMGPGVRFGSMEDNDLSWRALCHGWTVLHTPDLFVIHDGFRDLDELRDLVTRDFYGVGGGMSKYIRSGQLRALGFVGSWLIRFGLLLPMKDVLRGQRPTGFRRSLMLLKGLAHGLRTPYDAASLRFAFEPGGVSDP